MNIISLKPKNTNLDIFTNALQRMSLFVLINMTKIMNKKKFQLFLKYFITCSVFLLHEHILSLKVSHNSIIIMNISTDMIRHFAYMIMYMKHVA